MIEQKKETPSSNSRREFIKQTATALAGFIIVPRYVLGGNRPDGSKYIAPSDMITLGFIGCGKQGRILSNSFLSTNEIRILALSEVYNDKTELMLKTVKANQEKYKQTGNQSDIEHVEPP